MPVGYGEIAHIYGSTSFNDHYNIESMLIHLIQVLASQLFISFQHATSGNTIVYINRTKLDSDSHIIQEPLQLIMAQGD